MKTKIKKVDKIRGKKKAEPKKIRYAVVGLGWIAQSSVLPAFEHAHRNSELTALISSDVHKLDKLGNRYRVPNLYMAEDYEKCLSSGLIDAVYIALPNNLHCQFTVAAAQAGIHVLCEKPMAMGPQECETMLMACEDNNVKLMIAYRLHFDRANLQAVKLASSNKLGDVRLFSSVFTQYIKDKNNYRLRSEFGGGPLFDLGIYCINAARYIFQDEPVEVYATTSRSGDPKFSEVEESATAIMNFADGRVAQFTCSFGANESAYFDVVGTKGKLHLEPAYGIGQKMNLEVTTGQKKKRTIFSPTDQFAPELLYFSDCILKNRPVEPSGVEGLIDVNIMSALYLSANEGRSIRLEPLPIKRHPTVAQEMKIAPVRHLRLVNATPAA